MRNAAFATLAISLACVLSMLSSGCAIGLGKSLHEYSVLDRPLDYSRMQHRKIHADATQDVVFAAGNTDFADEAYQKLLEQCPRGRIVNVSARYTTELGFFAYRNEMRLDGVCLE